MKRIFALILSLSILVAICSVPSLALDDSRVIYNDDGDKIVVHTISPDDLPEGVVPLEVESVEAADSLIQELTTRKSQESDEGAQTRGTGDGLIQREQYGGIFSSGSMVTELRVSYTTGVVNGQRGITWANPYTVTTGIPIFAKFTENSCTGYISKSKKDYYAEAHGQVDYYLIANGIINWYTKGVTLSGWLHVLH